MSESSPPPRRAWPQRGTSVARPASQLLLESFLVALGVVLALAANEWHEGREQRELALSARNSIHEELAINREAVETSLRYHTGLIDTLDSLLRQSRVSGTRHQPTLRLFSRGFIHPATLLSTAWESAKAVDAVRHMAYEDVLAISKIYEAQERYGQQSQVSGEIIYRALYQEGTDGIIRNYANLMSILHTFGYRERELLDLFDTVLSQLAAPSSGP